MRKVLTLSLVHQHPRVLLGMKKRGFGMGRWNGFGGKLDKGETVEQAAVRELREEAGITAEKMTKVGLLEFRFRGEQEVLEVHVFRVERFSGEPKETEEMRPQWFPVEEIPFESMWPDDRYWMPLFLEGKTFEGSCLFDGPDTIVEFSLTETDRIPEISRA